MDKQKIREEVINKLEANFDEYLLLTADKDINDIDWDARQQTVLGLIIRLMDAYELDPDALAMTYRLHKGGIVDAKRTSGKVPKFPS